MFYRSSNPVFPILIRGLVVFFAVAITSCGTNATKDPETKNAVRLSGKKPVWQCCTDKLLYETEQGIGIYDFAAGTLTEISDVNFLDKAWVDINTVVLAHVTSDTVTGAKLLRLYFYNFSEAMPERKATARDIPLLPGESPIRFECVGDSLAVLTVNAGRSFVAVCQSESSVTGHSTSRFYGVVSHSPMVYVSGQPYWPDSDTWLTGSSGNELKRLRPGIRMFLPSLSPNRDRVVGHLMDGTIAVFDTSGVMIDSTGIPGTAVVWSQDGGSIFFNIDVEDSTGDEITASSVQQYVVGSASPPQLISRNVKNAEWPLPSPSGKLLAVIDGQQTEATIFVLRLEGPQ